MLKRITLLTVFFATLASASLFAQSNTATQTIHIQVAPAIEIGNGNGNGNNGNGNGKGKGNTNNNGNHGNGNNGNHGNGNNGNGNGGQNKTSNNNSDQDFTVNSTKEFLISVKAIDEASSDILLALGNNNTGGKVNPAFSSDYAPVNSTNQELLMNCGFGHKKNFTVNYKKKNNNNEQRITKADLIYTATLP